MFVGEKSRFMHSVVPASFMDWPGGGDDVWHESLTTDQCVRIVDLGPCQGEVLSELACILGKTDEATECSLRTAIDHMRRSLAAAFVSHAAIGNDLVTAFTNEIDTRFDARFLQSSIRMLDDLAMLKTLESSPPGIKERVAYAQAVEVADRHAKSLKVKFQSVELYKLGIVTSVLQALYPHDWEDFTCANFSKERTKEFINSNDTQKLGTVTSSFKHYVDTLHAAASKCPHLVPWVEELDATGVGGGAGGAFNRAKQAITAAQCALAGAKFAKTVHFKIGKLKDDQDGKKKKRDMVRNCKESLSTLEIQDSFPSSVLAALNSC